MDNIPKITEEVVQEQFKLLSELVMSGTLTKWLDKELEHLNADNPILLKFIMERSHKFAMGAIMVREPQAIAISFALEQIIMLKVLGIGFSKTLGLEKFTNMMQKWLKDDNLRGLDKLGENDKK